MSRNGILAAGNFIVDKVKTVDVYPAQDCLANILSVKMCNGGGPYNLLTDLRQMQVPFPLAAAGLVGDDQDGHMIVESCHGIDTSMLRMTTEEATSSTDVMAVAGTGRRTFFHFRGANALFDASQIDFEAASAKIFYLGYLLLLDRLDQTVGEETVGAQLLRKARESGMVTAVDAVSEDSHRFREVVVPALRHTDVLFMNEIEAERTTRVAVTDPTSAARACGELFRLGVNGAVFIHMVDGAYGKTRDGEGAWHGSVRLPQDQVAGAVGAGDAFAAGVLAGWHEGLGVGDCLRQGVCVAAACLTDQTTSGGVAALRECLALGDRHGFR